MTLPDQNKNEDTRDEISAKISCRCIFLGEVVVVQYFGLYFGLHVFCQFESQN
jgi:hypothetical protein